MKKFKITKGNKVYIVDAKSHIDAINKVKSIKDGSIDYGTLTIDLNSPNELTSSKIVQELKNRIGNNKIAEIRGGTFIPLREYGSASLELDFKEFRYNDWGTNSITLAVSWTVPAMDKALKNDPKYGAYKLRAELNNKLKQFANKTIYSNKSFTMDSAIRDYSPEVYINELKKLVTEYDKFRNLKEKLKQFYSETGKTKFSDIKNDARFRQWVKGVTDINNRWNAVIENLNRFGMHGYRMDSDISSIWWNTLPDRYMLKDIRYDIDRTAKFNKNKDSISQWKPGMSEIGLFQISYKKGTVNQSILVKAATKEDAINKFTKHTPDAEVIGVNEYPNPHFGEPILDSKIKDIDEYKKNYAAAMRAAGEKAKKDQINSDIQKLYDIAKQYGPVRTEQHKFNVEFEHQNMQVVLDRFYNDKDVKRVLKQLEDLDTKWNAIVDKYKFWRHYRIPEEGPNRFIGSNTPTKKWVDEIKKQLLKDSAIKDEDYSKYLSIVKQLEKLVEPANRALQQKIEKYGVTKQDIRNNSPKYRDVCREIPELKVWAKLIMQLPGVLQGTMPAYPSQESVDKLKKVVTNGKAFDSAIKDSYGWSYIMAPMKTPGDKDLNILRNLRSTYYDDMYQDVYNIRKAFAKATNKRVAINMAKDMPEYAKFIRTLDSADKDWNAIISKYPSLKKFKINTTGAERLLYGYYPTLKDFVDEITPVIKKEW